MNALPLNRLGVHSSVDRVFPTSHLRSELAELEVPVTVVSESSLSGCDALVTFEYKETFLSAGLSWIHSVQAGVDRFPFDRLQEEGIRLTSSAGIHGDSVGETVLGFVLSFARRLYRYRDAQARGEWQKEPWNASFTVAGEQLCVVGLGTLGRAIAARADGLGMDVVGVKRTPVPVDHVRRVYPTRELREALQDARFVVLAVPLTEETEDLIGRAQLSAMPEDAYLINVARGEVVDETALIGALRDGEIAGAGLDVFETEPLPSDSPLWDLEEVLVTPHVGGMSMNYCQRVGALVRENVRRMQGGRSLANQVV